MISNTDKELLKFIETNKSITLNQCANIFYGHMKYKEQYAYKRLKQLVDTGLIKKYKIKITNQSIYTTTDFLHVQTEHDNFIVEFYSQLCQNNAKLLLLEFKPEYKATLNHKKIIPDGYVKFKYNGYVIGAFIEVNLSHIASIKRYEVLNDSGEVVERLGGFPLVVTIGVNESNFNSSNFTVINFDYKFTNFKKKMLDWIK